METLTKKQLQTKTLIQNYINSQSYQEEFKDVMLNMLDTYGVEMFNISGIGEQLDINSAVKQLVNASSTAGGTIDGNANVGGVTAGGLLQEINKPHLLIQSYYRIWKWLKKNRGLDVANTFVEKQINGAIYMNDMHYIVGCISYCYNHSVLTIINQGLIGIDEKGDALPPKHLRSYFDQIEAYLLIAGSNTAGATGIAGLMLGASIFMDKILKTGKDSGVPIGDPWRYLKEELTSLVYRLNQPSRHLQSLFTNVSIFDDYFLDTVIPEYFAIIDDEVYQPSKELVKKVQQVYLDVINEESKRRVLTFPVTTACFSIKRDENTGKTELRDYAFLKQIAEANLETAYINIYAGETSTLSSCCFDENQRIKVKINDIECGLTFKGLEDRGYKTGDYIEVYDQGIYRPAEYLKVVKVKPMYDILLENYSSIKATADHLFPIDDTTDVTAQDLYEGKVDYLLNENNQKVKIKQVATYESEDKFVYCFKMKDTINHYFTLGNGIRVSNCRLQSDKSNKFFNSLGGASDAIGSFGVVSVNLPRIAYKHKGDIEGFMQELEDTSYLAQECNYAKRCLLKSTIAKGHAPLYTNGYMDLKNQFSTLGFVGLYEACEILGYDITKYDGMEIGKDILGKMKEVTENVQEKYKIACNLEGVPAEGLAPKFTKKDRVLELNTEYKLYANQFIPLHKRCNMLNRIQLQAEYDKYCSGGSILHLNVDQKIDLPTMENLIEAVIQSGTRYFALNYNIYQCNKCKGITVGTTSTCSHCGSTDIERYLRVVGFITKVKDWVPARIEEDRQFYKV